MNLNWMKKLCDFDIESLKKYLYNFLVKHNYKNIMYEDEFIVAEGQLPFCLIAHVDTVFPEPRNNEYFFYDNNKKVLWNSMGSGFDDRAGIYAILNIIESGYKPHIVFTDEEELGALGAKALINKIRCPFIQCGFLIQLDRANEKDMVFYNCNNKDYIDFIGQFDFEFAKGTYTDISIIAPAWGVAAVNLSIGYEFEHTTSELLHCDWCDATIEKVKKICELKDFKCFNYVSKRDNTVIEVELGHKNCLYCGVDDFTNYKMFDRKSKRTYYCCPDCFIKYELNNEVKVVDY